MNKFFSKFLVALMLISQIAKGTWSERVVIGKGAHGADVNISMNENNEVQAIWVGGIFGNEGVQSSYYSGSWSKPINCSAVGNYLFTEPRVALNNNGEAIGVWCKNDYERSSLCFGLFSEGVLKKNCFLLRGAVKISNLQVAFNNSGEGVAVWITTTDTIDNVFANIYSNNKWGEAIWLGMLDAFANGETAQVMANAQLALNDAGDIAVVWEYFDGDSRVIRAVVRTRDNVWTPRLTVSLPSQEAWNPKIAMNDQGEIIVIWIGRENGKNDVLQASSFSKGEWSSPIALASTTNNDGFFLSVSLNNNGNAIATWQISRGGKFVLHAMRKFQGTWSEQVPISQRDLNCVHNKVILNDLEKAIVVYGIEMPVSPKVYKLPIYHGYAIEFSKEKWQEPSLIFPNLDQRATRTLDIAFGNSNKAWVIGSCDDNTIKVIEGNL